MSIMYVVTDTELGWNCVIGVYDDEGKAEEACRPNSEDYISDPDYYDRCTDDKGMYQTRIIHKRVLNNAW